MNCDCCGVGEKDSTVFREEGSTAEVSQESNPSSIDTTVSRQLESPDVGLYGDLGLISLDLEVTGRTTCDREDRKEEMVSELARDRPLDDCSDLDSMVLSCKSGAVCPTSSIFDTGCRVSGLYCWMCLWKSFRCLMTMQRVNTV